MDLRQLRYFLEIAREKSFTRAATRLFVSQPALSKQISDLEKVLPDDKFFRCHRSYIVNLDQVLNIERYQATMRNGDLLPISQQQYTELKNRLSQ